MLIYANHRTIELSYRFMASAVYDMDTHRIDRMPQHQRQLLLPYYQNEENQAKHINRNTVILIIITTATFSNFFMPASPFEIVHFFHQLLMPIHCDAVPPPMLPQQ